MISGHIMLDTHHSREESEKTMLAIKRKVPKTGFEPVNSYENRS